jgi:transposase
MVASSWPTIFEQHPDAKIIRSLPGLGMILGARALAEFGDDPNRFDDAKSRKNYASTSPITRASGKHRVVLARYARNRRLATVCYLWAFAAISASPGARTFYDKRRATGDTHRSLLSVTPAEWPKHAATHPRAGVRLLRPPGFG